MKLPFFDALKRQYNTLVDGRGLALFRICYGLVLFFEIRQIHFFQHLVFDPLPYITLSDVDFSPGLKLWCLCTLFVALGLFTRVSTILNYVLSLVFVAFIDTYEYHMFYVYTGLNFMMLFMPVSRTWSLDRLLLKLRYSSARHEFSPPSTVSKLNYTMPVFLALGLVYADSIYYKVWSPGWMSGIGLWLPSSLPMITTNSFPWLIDQQWFVRGLGFLTVFFEFIFIFIMWFRWSRWPLFIIGMGLHLGILVYFPIPWFALGVMGLYFLVMPLSVFRWFDSLMKSGPGLKFFYDQECPLCVRTKIVISHFDVFGKVQFLPVQAWHEKEEALQKIPYEQALNSIYSLDSRGKLREGYATYVEVFRRIPVFFPLYLICLLPGISLLGKAVYRWVAANRNLERCTDDNCGYIPPHVPTDEDQIKIFRHLRLGELKFGFFYAYVCLLIFIQLIISYHSGIVLDWRRELGLSGTAFDRQVQKFYGEMEPLTRGFIGFTNHPVFMDLFHFNGYNHEIKVNYVDGSGNLVNIPVINEDGTPGEYSSGFTFVKWTFRVMGPQVNQEEVQKGIRDFTAFWAGRNHISLQDAEFRVFVRHVDSVKKWEDGFLKRQMEKPWIPAGRVFWKDKQYYPELEKLTESGLDSLVSGKAKISF